MMDLERARRHLNAWLDAELAVSQAQSYRILNKEVTRADLPHIRQQIKYWQNEVNRLSGKKRRNMVRVMPRDL